MTRRLTLYCAILACGALLGAPAARSEVYAEVNAAGSFVGMHTVVLQGAEERIWKPLGAAERSSYVLNPEGDGRGDGRPDFAVDPQTGLPRAVWAAKTGSDFDILTSAFDGVAWSDPVRIQALPGADDLDPRIVFRRDGFAIVTWWQKGPAPVVRMAFMTPDGDWIGGGVVSAAGVRAKKPVMRQEGMLTIVAYRTPKEIGIVTFVAGMVSPGFGDGPTPFPRDENGGSDNGSPPAIDN